MMEYHQCNHVLATDLLKSKDNIAPPPDTMQDISVVSMNGTAAKSASMESDHRREKADSPENLEPRNPLSPKTQSSSDVNISDVSPADESKRITASAKHAMIVRLMRHVYTLCGFPSEANVRTCTNNENGKSSAQVDVSQSGPDNPKRNRKRAIDWDIPPSDDDNEEGKRKSKSKKRNSASLLLACPFYKYNNTKYCVNSDTGSSYRSCTGPGFETVSRVR